MRSSFLSSALFVLLSVIWNPDVQAAAQTKPQPGAATLPGGVPREFTDLYGIHRYDIPGGGIGIEKLPGEIELLVCEPETSSERVVRVQLPKTASISVRKKEGAADRFGYEVEVTSTAGGKEVFQTIGVWLFVEFTGSAVATQYDPHQLVGASISLKHGSSK